MQSTGKEPIVEKVKAKVMSSKIPEVTLEDKEMPLSLTLEYIYLRAPDAPAVKITRNAKYDIPQFQGF